MSDEVIAAYDVQAAELAERYDHEALLAAYRPLDDLLDPRAADALALDIGAGSGRDAAWLVAKGYEVVAVEPSAGMRFEELGAILMTRSAGSTTGSQRCRGFTNWASRST
ncbi:hypothetical protein ACFSHP_01985 [Novosphingobium panipatense]